MDKEIGNATDLIDLEGSDASQSDKYCQIDNKEIDELYTSYNLMKQFSSDPTLQSIIGVDEILSKYAERPIDIEILPKNVMSILDKRIERMLKNKRLKKNWSNEDAQILFWTFSNFCKIYNINTVEQAARYSITANSTVWEQISKLIPGSSPDSCMFKVLSLKKTKLAKQKWSDYQSKLLAQVAKKFSNKKNWRMISQELFKLNNSQDKAFRNAKQCKQHWVCYLNPEIKKGSWSPVEDKKLMEHIYTSRGSKKWAEIARVFGGRTENALKNRYTLIIQRLRKQNNEQKSDNDLQYIGEYLSKIEKMEMMQVNKKTNQEKRRSARNSPLETEARQKAEKSVKVQPAQITQKQNIAEQPNNYSMLNYIPMSMNIDYCSPFLAMSANRMMPMSMQCPSVYHNPTMAPSNQMYVFYPSFNNLSFT